MSAVGSPNWQLLGFFHHGRRDDVSPGLHTHLHAAMHGFVPGCLELWEGHSFKRQYRSRTVKEDTPIPWKLGIHEKQKGSKAGVRHVLARGRQL